MRILASLVAGRGRSEEAEGWLYRAIDGGDTAAMVALATRLAATSRPAAAEPWLRRATEAGNPHGLDALLGFLTKRRPDEADQLRRYGINAGGLTAEPW
jgi:hypothetical protein